MLKKVASRSPWCETPAIPLEPCRFPGQLRDNNAYNCVGLTEFTDWCATTYKQVAELSPPYSTFDNEPDITKGAVAWMDRHAIARTGDDESVAMHITFSLNQAKLVIEKSARNKAVGLPDTNIYVFCQYARVLWHLARVVHKLDAVFDPVQLLG